MAPSHPSCCLTAAEAPLCLSDCCYMKSTENLAFFGHVCWESLAQLLFSALLLTTVHHQRQKQWLTTSSKYKNMLYCTACRLLLPAFPAFTAQHTQTAIKLWTPYTAKKLSILMKWKKGGPELQYCNLLTITTVFRLAFTNRINASG